MVFTHTLGYSRPPSAVNDPTVTKQVKSGKCLEEVSQLLVDQVALINKHWVRLHFDFQMKKESTMILANSAKKQNFVPIVRQCLFQIRSVPDWHSIGNLSCSNESTNYFCNYNFLLESNGVYYFRPQDHPLCDTSSVRPISIIFLQKCSSPHKSVMESLEELIALLLELGWRCSIPCLLASSSNGAHPS